MAKIITLFGEEEFIEKVKIEHHNSALPLIPLAKKKASKNDTPLEKEIRRFNRLIKQIQEYEDDQRKQRDYENEYDRLYHQLLVPELIKLAKLKYEFALHLHHIFSAAKFGKPEHRQFTELIINLLSADAEFVPDEGRELARIYLNKQVELLSKKEKSAMKEMMEDQGFLMASMDDFDIGDIAEQNKSRFEKEAFDFHRRKEKEKKTKVPEIADISTLYKELAKQLHPDLEQDEDTRHAKEQLMKELGKAKRENDLHGMLIIKAKAQQFDNAAAAKTEYSLTQLKKYNKLLQQKLHGERDDFLAEQFSSFGLNNGFITNFVGSSSPKEKIKEELADVEIEIKSVRTDMKAIKTADDLRNLLRSVKQQMNDLMWRF